MGEVLFGLLTERYERRSVMVTSKLGLSQWHRNLPDQMATAAAIGSSGSCTDTRWRCTRRARSRQA